MRKLAAVIGVGVVVLAVAGWHYRGRLWQGASTAVSAPAPETIAIQQKPDVLYTWVDKDGVTHFEQDSGHGSQVVYDGSRITPLVPPPTSSWPKIETASDAVQEKGEQGLHKLRNELEAGAQRMRESRRISSGDL
jgi:hypothetical protein